jgi:hypothetical protein
MYRIQPAIIRIADDWGGGLYGDSRGVRDHNGVDYRYDPGEPILSPVVGRVSKLGYPYQDDLSYRYLEVTALTNYADYRWRFFYVEPKPGLSVGDDIGLFTVLGKAQDISARYPANADKGTMGNHVHLEIIDTDGEYVNPKHLLPINTVRG